MIVDFLNQPIMERNIFNCVSTTNFTTVQNVSNIGYLDYMINRNTSTQDVVHFHFVQQLFENQSIAFSYNLPDVISVSNQLFQGAKPLEGIELEVLLATFESSLKSKSTLPRRK